MKVNSEINQEKLDELKGNAKVVIHKKLGIRPIAGSKANKHYHDVACEMIVRSHFRPHKLGKGSLFQGTVGIGKSEMLRLVRAEGKAFDMFTMSEVSAMYNDSPRVYAAAVKNSPRHLILDDVGTETQSIHMGARLDVFCDLVDARYDYWCRTGWTLSISTNANWDSLEKKYGKRTVSRLKQMTSVVAWADNDLRQQL